MSFTTRIQNYTNSTSGENVTDALKKGVDYVIGVVNSNNPDMLRLFAYKIDLNMNGVQALEVLEQFNLSHLVDVKRGTKFCRPVTDRQIEDVLDSSSIYFALETNPVYFMDGAGKLTIAPSANGSNKGTLYGVAHSRGRSIDDTNEAVRNTGWSFGGVSHIAPSTNHSFPKIMHELLVMHSAECILMERLADFRTSIPAGLDAEWTDALAKAKKLFDDGANIQGDNAGASMSVQYWLNDEDEDMAETTIQAISSELGRASQYNAKFKADLERLTVDYQWTQGQIQMLNQKKQEFIATHINIGPQGSPEGESKV